MVTRAEPDVNADARGEIAVPGVRVEAVDAARLVGLLEGPACSLAELRRALHAHRLAGAESFTELLSIARLVGVERHGSQIETVHRVLRTLRGGSVAVATRVADPVTPVMSQPHGEPPDAIRRQPGDCTHQTAGIT